MTFWTRTRRVSVHVFGAACVAAVALLAQQSTGATTPPSARTVAVQPQATTLVCPAPATLDQQDAGDDQFDATPVETVSDVTMSADSPDLGGLDASVDGTDPADGAPSDHDATVLRAAPGVPAAATATSVTTAGDLRGLVAGRCREPAVEHWLVGGSSDVGSSSRLVLQNPGSTAASVSLTVWGPAGQVTLGSRAAVVVPAGEQVQTTLEAIAPEQRRVVVRAVSHGARVNAYLQHHRIDGLVPQGADLVTGGAAPSSSVAVAGVTSRGESVSDPNGPVLRLLAPGDDDGSARVSVYGTEGRAWPRGLEDVTLTAGSVTDVPLGGLPEGRYTVTVDATVPVLGAGLVRRTGAPDSDAVVDGAPRDTAWIPGQPVPSGPEDTNEPESADDAAEERETDDPGAPRVAVPATAWSVNIGAIPADRDDDAEPTGALDVTVTGYGADGDTTGTADLTLSAGKNVLLSQEDLKPLGEDVAAIAVSSPGTDGQETTAVWSLLLAAKGGLVAVLTPPESTGSRTTIPVQDVPVH